MFACIGKTLVESTHRIMHFGEKKKEKWGLIGLTDIIMCSVPYFISYQLLSLSELPMCASFSLMCALGTDLIVSNH